MGWSNPMVPWSELERALSGRPPLPGRGPDDSRPAGSRRSGSAGPTALTVPTVPTVPVEPHVPYVELHCHSAFSFLDGSSTPEMLVAEALRLGLQGMALTDHDGFYGIVRFSEAAADTAENPVRGGTVTGSARAPARPARPGR